MTCLQPRPLMILSRLADHDGPVSLWALVNEISPGSADDGPIRTYISRLRDALGADAIQTVRLVGYQLTEKGRAAYARLCA